MRIFHLAVFALASASCIGGGGPGNGVDETEPGSVASLDWSCYQRAATGDVHGCFCESERPDPGTGHARSDTASHRANLDDTGELDYALPTPQEVPFCTAALDCCHLLDDGGHFVDCDCVNLGAVCEAEAASRPGVEVVAACPPGGGSTVGRCAAAGENCTEEYLADNSYFGCCDGLLCDQAAAVPVCR